MCKVIRKLPFIPTESELDIMVASAGWKNSVYLQILKETAMRAGEVSKLKWFDADLKRKGEKKRFYSRISLKTCFRPKRS